MKLSVEDEKEAATERSEEARYYVDGKTPPPPTISTAILPVLLPRWARTLRLHRPGDAAMEYDDDNDGPWDSAITTRRLVSWL